MDTRIVIEHVDKQLKRKFKTSCTIKGTTMSSVIIAFIEEYANQTIHDKINELNSLIKPQDEAR